MKKIVTLLLVVLALLAGTVPAFAEAPPSGLTVTAGEAPDPSVMPRLSHCVDADFSFHIADGEAVMNVDYTGTSTFERAELTIQIDKKVLGLFWRGVDNASSTNYNRNGTFDGRMAITEGGTYRATFTLTIYGTDGTADVIEKALQYTYNP